MRLHRLPAKCVLQPFLFAQRKMSFLIASLVFLSRMHACLFTQKLWESQAGLQSSNRLLWDLEGNIPNNHVCYANDKTAYSPLNLTKALQISEITRKDNCWGGFWVTAVTCVPSGVPSHSAGRVSSLSGQCRTAQLGLAEGQQEHQDWTHIPRSFSTHPVSSFSLPCTGNNVKWQLRECCSNWCLSWWNSKAWPSSAASVTPALSRVYQGIHSNYLIFEEISDPLLENVQTFHLSSGYFTHPKAESLWRTDA